MATDFLNNIFDEDPEDYNNMDDWLENTSDQFEQHGPRIKQQPTEEEVEEKFPEENRENPNIGAIDDVVYRGLNLIWDLYQSRREAEHEYNQETATKLGIDIAAACRYRREIEESDLANRLSGELAGRLSRELTDIYNQDSSKIPETAYRVSDRIDPEEEIFTGVPE